MAPALVQQGTIPATGPASGTEDEVANLREQVRRLEKINAALMDRVERSTDIQGGAYSMFETAISLETMVRERTAALEEALDQINAVNARLAAANADANASRRRLRDAIESLTDGFALFDAADRLVMCNRAFLKIWPEFTTMTAAGPEFTQLAEKAASSGSTIGSRLSPERWIKDRVDRHRRAEGAHVQAMSDGRWVQINEMRTSEGGTVGIYTDITSVKAEDARQRTRELAERNLALQATLDTLSEGVCLFDPSGRLQAWNGELLDMLQVDSPAASLPDGFSTHDDLVAWCTGQRGLDCADALAWRVSGTRRSADCVMGERHFVIRSVPLSSGGMVLTFDDVTEHIQFHRSLTETAETLERHVAERTGELVEVNRQLVVAKNEAETANRSKTSFLAAASHDLLQPLNAARLFVSALDGQALPPRPRSLVEQTATALDSVEDLLEALFEISRLDAGATLPEITALPLDHILGALRIEFTPLAQAGDLALTVPVTGLWVRSDGRLLRRVLQNFLSNAIRYTAAGSVTVETTRHGESVTVTVRDTGPGIARADRERIFEEFRRLGHSRRIPGKGLGLAIVRRVSTMLGHQIDLESSPGEGAAFSILLPLAVPVPQAKATQIQRSAEATRRGGVVLVVDNDPGVLSGMEALLENWGLDVIAVGSPDDPAALAALSAGAGPALCIVDYHLNDGLTGDAAIAQLRSQGRPDLPAIVITADRAEDTKATLAEQALPLLHKPVKPAQLRALLRRLEIL
jgi:signal transduction histidine kinase